MDFNNQRYSEVIEKCDRYILDFNGEPIVTKFEFLKALAIARVYGFKEYKKALSFIKLNYSSTSEGKEAERILDEVLPLVKNDKFVSKNLSNNYKIVYKFDSSSSSINKQTNELKKYIVKDKTTNYVVLYIASEKLIDLVVKIDDLRQECLTEKKV